MSKIAGVLAGEGSKGSFQALVLKQLSDKGVRFDLMVGTSSGALNAVGYSLFGAEKLCAFWNDIKSITDVFSFNWQFLWQSGVFTTKPLKKKLEKMVGSRFSIPVCFPTTNVETGETNFQHIGYQVNMQTRHVQTIIDAVTIPGVVRSDSGYVDGGAMILCPLKKAIDLGADEIYIILGRNPFVPKADFKPKKWLSFIAYGNRFLELLMFTVIKNDIANCVKINQEIKTMKMNVEASEEKAFLGGKKEIKLHILYPKRPLYDSLDFKRCREMLAMTDNILQIDDVDIRTDL